HLREVARGYIKFLVGMVRVRANRTINVVVRFRDLENLSETPNPRADRYHPHDPFAARAGDYGVTLGRKIGKIEMAMTVDKHAQAAFSSGSTKRGNTGVGAGSGIP